MKQTIGILIALLASPSVFAATLGSVATTGINGAGLQILGTASQTLGGKTVTLNVDNAAPAQPITAAPAPVTPGSVVNIGTFAAGLSIGNALGGGTGNTGGTAGTQSGQ